MYHFNEYALTYLASCIMTNTDIMFFITLLGEDLASASMMWNLDEAIIGLVIAIFIIPNFVKWIVYGFPNYRWKYLTFGCIFLVLGAFSGVFLERWNYWFFHSFWHVSLQRCCCSCAQFALVVIISTSLNRALFDSLSWTLCFHVRGRCDMFVLFVLIKTTDIYDACGIFYYFV